MPAPAGAAPAAAPPAVHLGVRKKIVFSLVVQVLALAGLEIGARVASYAFYGANPYYLLYGFRSWTDEEGEGHSEKHRGYFKFPPNDDITTGVPELPAHIGNHGMRGADFDAEKPAGTLRVVCMGASSTFGYGNLDDETYPHYLQEELAQRLPGERIEVINAGIPHFTTDHVVAMLRRELLGYAPDVLTFYEGYNDATQPMAENALQATSRWLDEYSAAYAGLRKLVTAVGGQALFGRWSRYLPHMDRAALQRQVDLHVARSRENFETMAELAEDAGIPLVLVRQPITLWFDRVKRGQASKDGPRPTYEQEYAAIAEQVEREGWVDDADARLYVHHAILEALDGVARERGLPVVDNVALLAEEPDGLHSIVHLRPEANARLARALAGVVAPLLAR